MICFQNYIFELLNTAKKSYFFVKILLWFAFRIISLNYWIQRALVVICLILCCDLLSELYLWTIEYSVFRFGSKKQLVVICFQNYIFELLNTAILEQSTNSDSLWFAFRIISLNYWIQQSFVILVFISRCDLLSELYLWTIEYSTR